MTKRGRIKVRKTMIEETSSNNDEHDDYIQQLCEDSLNVLFNPMLLLA